MATHTDFTAGLLRLSAQSYAKAAVHALSSVGDGQAASSLPDTFTTPLEDIEVRLLHLAASVSVDMPELFATMTGFIDAAAAKRGIEPRAAT